MEDVQETHKLKKIKDFSQFGDLEELHKLNTGLEAEYKKRELGGKKEYVLEGCSDSRFTQIQVDPERKAFVKYNAGNQFDPEDALHPEIDTYVILGHIKEGDTGCGACGVAGKLAFMDKAEIEQLKKDHPHLYNVGDSAKCSVRENLESAIKQKKEYAAKEGREIKVVGAIINHVTGKLEDEFLGDVEEASDIVALVKEGNASYHPKHSPTLDRPPYHLGKGQNPKILVYNTTGHEFAAYFGKDNELEKPNTVFESNQFQGKKVTSIGQGSLDYAFDHGLKSEEGHFHDFQDSNEFIALVNNKDELSGLAHRLKDDKAFQGWVERGGKAYGAIPGKRNKELVFYELQ